MENNINNNNNKSGSNKNRRRPHHRGNRNNKNRNENIIKEDQKKQSKEENSVNVKATASDVEEFGILFDNDFICFPNSNKKEPTEEYTFTEEEINAILSEKESKQDDRPRTEIIGIRFKKVGKMYYFSPNGMTIRCGESAIVETARGLEFGEVCLGNRMVPTDDIVLPLRPVVRIATEEDITHNKENTQKEAEAFRVCLEKITEHELDMKLVDAQYTFDNSKLIFYFTSAGRVDFRDLVKDLASVFRTRIELRQIGIRDEAKLMGGLGVCGRPLCCATFLSNFVQVSIKMAKEQSLSLNSNKISGACGRLMCCLRYEYDTYQEEIANTPPVDSIVETPEGKGTVVEISPLAGTVKVKFVSGQEQTVKLFKRELCKVISKPEIIEEKN